MTAANKRKGNAWELAVTRFLAEALGPLAYRPHAQGFKDVGDVHATHFTVQAKDVAAHDLSGWLDDVELQRQHAGRRWGVVVVKRRRHGVGTAYALMTLATFRAVAARLHAVEAALLRADPAAFDHLHDSHL